MKTKLLFISLTLGPGLALALVLLWLLGATARPAQADPGTLCVAPSGGGCDPLVCGGVCYASVQAAVDQAVEGDEILVASGVYTGVQNIPGLNTATFTATQVVAITKTITIRGGYTPTDWTAPYPFTQPVTLDAQGQGRVLYVTGNISPTIEGLRITGGNAEGLGVGTSPAGRDAGGGVYVISATATLSNNQVFSNTADYGGGLVLQDSDATLSSNTVTSNTAYCGGCGSGGGGLLLYYSDATLSDNTVISNTAEYGGGLLLHQSNATLDGHTVVSNTANYIGGGLFLYYSDATINSSTVFSNTAELGGGLYLDRGNPTLVNDVVTDNRAESHGSGLYIGGSFLRLLHTTIARNSGGDGSGVYVTNNSTASMTNTILVNHTVGITVTGGNTVTVNSVLWYGTPITISQAAAATVRVQSHRQGNPAFATDGYHLTSISAAIDKGVDGGVTTDIDGQSRDAFPDLGADECTGEIYRIYLPIILKSYP